MRSVPWARLMLLLLFYGCSDAGSDGRQRLGAMRLGAVLGGADQEGFATADRVPSLRFPRDLGPHPEYRSEWWYLTLMLMDGDGHEYGAQFTVFRQALWPAPISANPWQSNQVYLAHLAVTDVSGRRHVERERIARGHPRLAGAQSVPFRVWLEDWQLRLEQPDRWALQATSNGVGLDLTLVQSKPIVLQGDRGLSEKGPGQASYYYSIPRLAVSGNLVLDDVSRFVTGNAWLDREWSTSVLGDAQVGWDWLALQLDDGSELMAFQLRRSDGGRDPYNQGLRVSTEGTAQRLAATDFELEPLQYWQDEKGVRWPVIWRVKTVDLDLRVEAALADQRMDTTLVYWEGLVHVYDRENRRIGRGYMELTGYADD